MDHSATSSAEEKCWQCGRNKSLGGKTLKAGECNVCIVVNETIDAYGEVLMKHFPEAKYGDQSPLRWGAVLNALEAAAAEWIENNFPEQEHGEDA